MHELTLPELFVNIASLYPACIASFFAIIFEYPNACDADKSLLFFNSKFNLAVSATSVADSSPTSNIACAKNLVPAITFSDLRLSILPKKLQSLELAKEGLISIMQKKNFDKLIIKEKNWKRKMMLKY